MSLRAETGFEFFDELPYENPVWLQDQTMTHATLLNDPTIDSKRKDILKPEMDEILANLQDVIVSSEEDLVVGLKFKRSEASADHLSAIAKDYGEAESPLVITVPRRAVTAVTTLALWNKTYECSPAADIRIKASADEESRYTFNPDPARRIEIPDMGKWFRFGIDQLNFSSDHKKD